MATHYQFTILDPKGNALDSPKNFVNGGWALRVNSVGNLTLPLPARFVPPQIDDNYQVLIERQVEDGLLYIEGSTTWLTEIIKEKRTSSEHTVTLGAPNAMTLLTRRINAYAAGTANAGSTSVAADNIIKSIVRANMGSTATDAARRLDTITPSLSVEANTSQGATTTKSYAWRNPILPVLQELAEDSAQNGTYLAFDVVKTPAGHEFRTFVNQRGANRSISGGFSPVIFSPGLGNITDIEFTTDYSQYVNYAYVGGQGDESNRVVIEVPESSDLATLPQYRRREGFRDARNTDLTASLQSEGRAYLREHRPRKIFTAKIVQTDSCKYGRDYFWGDRVTVDYYGLVFDCWIETLNINLANGTETIEINLQTVVN